MNPNFAEIHLDSLITHYVGNKAKDESFHLSVNETEIENETQKYLLDYFLLPFKTMEFYNFSHPVSLDLNEAFSITQNIFKGKVDFIPGTQNLAKLLYEYGTYPQIKSGEFNVVLFSDAIIGDELVNAIGIFKSETDVPFIKMKESESHFAIEHEFGYELKGMDKGCIIFDTDESLGYQVLVVDKSSNKEEAKYWKEQFLQITPASDDFFKTKEVMNITKDIITGPLSDEFELSNPDKIDFLNRSVNYFKENSQFDKNEFEQQVFQDDSLISFYRKLDDELRRESNLEISDQFDISTQAVKKQAKIFKSILKLDNNFHVYIHGDRSRIEHGIENDGRKFYKIYYDEEK